VNKQTFEQLYRRYFPPLCAYARRIVPPEDAEEIVGDVMMWVWEHPELDGQITSSLNSYLFSAVYHRAISRYRQTHAQAKADTRFYIETQLLDDVDSCQISDLYRHVEAAVSSLPETYREAFCLNRFDGKSYKEIAGQLGVSPKTVDYRIQQALKLLREALKEFLPLVAFLLCV
jgi:RNA polymerase sigma-70 factor (ECF subfamily)